MQPICLLQVSVDVAADSDERLGRSTNETYTIKVSMAANGGSSAIIAAQSVFGAMRGLETFSQLAELGGITSHLQVGKNRARKYPSGKGNILGTRVQMCLSLCMGVFGWFEGWFLFYHLS